MGAGAGSTGSFDVTHTKKLCRNYIFIRSRPSLIRNVL